MAGPIKPPGWLIKLRGAIYFVAHYWWAFTLAVVVLALIFGATWGQAARWALLALVLIVVSPGMLGVTIAVVSRAARARWEQEHPGEEPPQ